MHEFEGCLMAGIAALRYHRIEVLGALASVLSTWLVTGILVYEAVNRVISPSPVNGKGTPAPSLYCLNVLCLLLNHWR